MFKKPNLQTKEKEYRKEKVKDNAGDLFNELYYIYNESYTEGKSGLNTIDIQKFDYKKLWLPDDYEYESEEKEEKTQSDKKPDKKEPPKNLTKIDAKEFNEFLSKDETDINSELFQKHFSFRRPSEMLKAVYITNKRRKNEETVNAIKTGVSNLKYEIKEMYKNEMKLRNHTK